jgi:hypothetical protein
MKISSDFFAAKKDKSLSAFIVKQETINDKICFYMRLCLNVKIPFTDRRESVFIETDTDISIDNCFQYSFAYDEEKKQQIEIKNISFYMPVYFENHIVNFLNSIKKESNVKFKVIAFNSNENLNAVGFVSHQLYGIIDNKEYFLSDFTGKNNSASPINYTIKY